MLNHNLETVARLQRAARPSAGYARSLALLARSRSAGLVTKSGIILGMGETDDEVRGALADLRGVGVDIVTLGQYLRPSARHLPVVRWWHPDEFAAIGEYAESLGFAHVESGPLVRSSYHARTGAEAADRIDRHPGGGVMGRMLDSITPEIADFIAAQPVFFVATAPSDPDGRVNVSPKGLDTFAVLDERTVAWLDLTGSGIETVAHLRDNGRITVMFCAFDGQAEHRAALRTRRLPRGRRPGGRADPRPLPGAGRRPGGRARSRSSTSRPRAATRCRSCTYVGERPTLDEWAERRGRDGVRAYQAEKNAVSIDGLPGLPAR